MVSDLLVPTAERRHPEVVVACALDLAERYGARLHVLQVVDAEWSDLLDDRARQRLFARGADTAAALADRAIDRGLQVETAVREGVPYRVILEYVRAEAIDMVVLDVDEPGTLGEYALAVLRDSLLSGTTERVVRRARVPVVTVRD